MSPDLVGIPTSFVETCSHSPRGCPGSETLNLLPISTFAKTDQGGFRILGPISSTQETVAGEDTFPITVLDISFTDKCRIRVLIVQAFRLLRGIVLEEDTTDISTSHAADAASSTTVDKQRMLLERDGTAEPELTAVSVNQRPESTMTGST